MAAPARRSPGAGAPPHTHTPSTADPALTGLRWASALRTYPRRQRSQTTPRLPLHTVYAKGSERKSSSPGRKGAKARSPFPRSAVLNFSTFSGSILFTVSARQTPTASRSWLASRGQPESRACALRAHVGRGAGRTRWALCACPGPVPRRAGREWSVWDGTYTSWIAGPLTSRGTPRGEAVIFPSNIFL